MAVDLYGVNMSAPCRAVLLAAKGLDVQVNVKPTNPMGGETQTPEFLKMNIQHTIPTLDDNGFYMHESRAIIQYLANKYGQNDSLYPKDPKARAIVDMRLMFDMGTLYSRFGEAYYGQIFRKEPKNEEKIKKLDEALGYLEHYLKDGGYAAGSNLTIADFTIIASLTTVEAVGHDMSAFPGVCEYLSKMKKEMTGYEEANGEGAAMFGGFAKQAIQG